MRRRLATLLLAIMVALALAAQPAFAGGTVTAKCNSGSGNGQETTIENDCDPGNSAGHNQGGG